MFSLDLSMKTSSRSAKASSSSFLVWLIITLSNNYCIYIWIRNQLLIIRNFLHTFILHFNKFRFFRTQYFPKFHITGIFTLLIDWITELDQVVVDSKRQEKDSGIRKRQRSEIKVSSQWRHCDVITLHISHAPNPVTHMKKKKQKNASHTVYESPR